MPRRCIAVLGRPDRPTDGVEDYCQYLGKALTDKGASLEILRVQWADSNWRESVREVCDRTEKPAEAWFLLQYTALAWSKHGFPTRVLRLVRQLKEMDARVAAVFHDAEGYAGNRWRDKIRRAIQIAVMRRLLSLADAAIFTVARETITWLPAEAKNVFIIPVGANLPNPEQAWSAADAKTEKVPVVAAFSVSSGENGTQEGNDIASAMRCAAQELGPVKLQVLGRNSDVAGARLKNMLKDTAVEVMASGVVSGDEIVRALGQSDVMLFTRGPISSRRGSAIAGIACGLPVIAQEGAETALPITEAGVELLTKESLPEAFGQALVRILKDRAYREALAERSRAAYKRHFSWSVIADKLIQALRCAEHR
jgi:glycosyltransferase involved in cell wall biosynthesis